MTVDSKQFFNLPKNKASGFCQPVDSSVWKDGGTVVEIHTECIDCTVAKCMMFEDVSDDNGNSIGKKFTPHEPQW